MDKAIVFGMGAFFLLSLISIILMVQSSLIRGTATKNLDTLGDFQDFGAGGLHLLSDSEEFGYYSESRARNLIVNKGSGIKGFETEPGPDEKKMKLKYFRTYRKSDNYLNFLLRFWNPKKGGKWVSTIVIQRSEVS